MTLRIATHNLLDFFEPSPEAPPSFLEEKMAFVASGLRRADADVVALQEVGSEPLVERLAKRELAGLGYAHVAFAPPDRRGIRCAILSRLPVLETHVHAAGSLRFPRFVESDPEPFGERIPLRRPLVHLRVSSELGPVDVLTLHFKSKLGRAMQSDAGEDLFDATARGFAESQLRSLVLRSAEALFVRGLVDGLLAEGHDKVAVVGDFNDTLDSLPVQIVSGTGRDLDPALVLSPAAALVPEARRFSARHGSRPQLIDHILVSQSLAQHLAGCEIFNEALRDHGPYDPEAPPATDSDHAVVLATFAPS